MSIFSRRPSGEISDGDDDGDLTVHDDERWRKTVAGRRVIWGSFGLLALVIAFVAWLGVNAISAKSNLEQARYSAQETKNALLKGDTDRASLHAADAQVHAESARNATQSLPWDLAAAIPGLGSPFVTAQEISNVVLGLAADVLKPSAEVGSVLAPDQLMADGRLNVRALRDEEPKLSQLSASALRLDAEASSIPEPSYLSVLDDARIELQKQTSGITQLLKNTALAAKIAPALMGADGPRSYFMGFQTPAESRGTGGLLGGFGVLRFVDGVPTVDELGPNVDLDKDFFPLDLGPEFAENYDSSNPSTDYRNSNQSSHFPYAAQIWKSMWSQQSGEGVDGVIALDPVALSYILGAVGSITMPDGEIITKDNVVELTMSAAYVRFADDTFARKDYLQSIASEVVKKVTGRLDSPREMLDALGKAVSERRIAMWSSSPEDQALLEETPLAHTVPDDPAPYAEVVINNLGGNKMDYYLTRDIEYVADGCDSDTRNSTVTVRLTNSVEDVPTPDYVAGAMGFKKGVKLDVPRGTMLSSVRLLATTGAKLESVLANGLRVPVFASSERSHPSFEVQLAIPPGETADVSFRLSEPTVAGAARVPIQPLVDEPLPEVSVPVCS